MSGVCTIEADGRIRLPDDVLESLREKSIHHVIVVQTWDGYRLEAISDADAADLLAADTDPVTVALRAVGVEPGA